MRKLLLILFSLCSAVHLYGQQSDLSDNSIIERLINIEKSTSFIVNKLDSCCNKPTHKPPSKNLSVKLSIKESDSIQYAIKFIDSSFRVVLTQLDSCNHKDKIATLKTAYQNTTKGSKNCDTFFCKYASPIVLTILLFLMIAIFYFAKRFLKDEFAKQLKEAITVILPQVPFIFISWSIGLILFMKVYCGIDFCSLNQIHYNHLLLLLFSVSLLLLPFLKSVKIGKIIELERNIKETKEEIKEFKTEIRQNFQSLNSNVSNAIRNLNSQVQTVNYYPPPPPDTKLPELESEIDWIVKAKLKEHGVSTTDNIDVPNNNIELFKVRYTIEIQLRRIWEGRFANTEIDYRLPHMPIMKIIKELLESEIIDRNFYSILREILSICNYAIHGEDVTENQFNFVEKNAKQIYDYLSKVK